MPAMEEKMLRCEIGNHSERCVLISLISLAHLNGISTSTCPALKGCHYAWHIFGQKLTFSVFKMPIS